MATRAAEAVTSYRSPERERGIESFSYETETHLVSARAGQSHRGRLRPFGRRARKTVNGTATKYLAAGNRDIADYRAKSWSKPRRVVAKIQFHPGELLSRVDFIVTNRSLPNGRMLTFYNDRGTGGAAQRRRLAAIK